MTDVPGRSLTIKNISPSMDVQVTIGQLGPEHIELPIGDKGLFKRSSEITLPFKHDGGCSTLYIWTLDKKLLWKAVVPLGTSLEINPESKKLSCSGIDLPSCSSEIRRIERFTGDGNTATSRGRSPSILTFALVTLVILGIAAFLLIL